MTDLALRTESSIAANDNVASSLPALVRKAASQLESATTAAEVLDARDSANLAYDAAKAAERFAKKQGAFNEVKAAVHRAMADALEVEARAQRRLAEEYEAAYKADLIAGPKGGHILRWENGRQVRVSDENPNRSLRELGITKTDIFRANRVKDVEEEAPGIVKASLDAIIDTGRTPTKAELSREINTRLNSFSGDNEWYTPARYVEMAREVMGTIDTDPASNPTAQRTVRAATYYTAETNGLVKPWSGKVWMNPPYSNPEIQQFAEKVISEFQKGNISEAIVLTNNSADTCWHRALQDNCTRMCTTTGRIRFESPTRQGNSPAMGQSFFYFGDDPDRFKDVFSVIGNVWMLA